MIMSHRTERGRIILTVKSEVMYIMGQKVRVKKNGKSKGTKKKRK